MSNWQLICPPDNWENALPISLGELRLLEMVGAKLGLTFTRDDERCRAYLGGLSAQEIERLKSENRDLKDALSISGEPECGGVIYPSGFTAKILLAGDEYETIDQDMAAPLIRAFPDRQLSKNFRLSEFRPGEHSYDLIRICPVLLGDLEAIRERAGGEPLHVSSGYRPVAYNRKAGGVANSTHIDGLAADIYSDKLTVDELYEICDVIIGDRGGVGRYVSQGFVHVDLRGHRARW